MNSKIGLVTVLYKSDNVLEDFFQSISKQRFSNFVLICVDNSPSTNTQNLITSLSEKYQLTDKLTHVENNENVGVAKGNNQGIEIAFENECEYIVLLNNDIVFSQTHLFEELVNTSISTNESIIIPKIFFSGEQSNLIWMAGGKLDKLRGLVTHVGEGEKDAACFNLLQYFNYAPTCFMLIHKRVFKTIGGMDENYFIYYDDVDFVYRAVKQNFKVYYLPSLEIYHKVGNSVGGFSPTYIYYFNRNRIYFSLKQLPLLYKITSLFFYFVTRLRWQLNFIGEKRKMNLKGVIDGLKMCFKKSKNKILINGVYY